jgi:hypothetical protein
MEAIGRSIQTSSETTIFIVMSSDGTLAISGRSVPTKELEVAIPDEWTYQKRPNLRIDRKFAWIRGNKELIVQFPTWLPVPLLVVVAGMPWLGFELRFSLRTLLIVMTAIAMLLCAIMFAII